MGLRQLLYFVALGGSTNCRWHCVTVTVPLTTSSPTGLPPDQPNSVSVATHA